MKERQPGLRARALRARHRLWWAKHWGRGVSLVAATALEDRRRRRAPSPEAPASDS
jgi:hypothetical protein